MAERRASENEHAQAPCEVEHDDNNSTTTSPSRDMDRSRDGTTTSNPFSDTHTTHNNEDTVNDDSWSSNAAIHPLERMSDKIPRLPGTPEGSVDLQRAGPPRRTASVAGEDPFATPHGQRAPMPPNEYRNPFNSPLRTPARRGPSDNFSSSARRAAFDPLLALPLPPRQTVRPSSPVVASPAGFQLSAPPPPRRPDAAHIVRRDRRAVGDYPMRGRPSGDYAVRGGRGSTVDTMSRPDTGSSSRSTTGDTVNTTAPPSRQTTASSLGGRSLAGRTLATPFPEQFTAANDTFRSPTGECTASTEGMKDEDSAETEGTKRGLLGSLGRKASRVLTKSQDSGGDEGRKPSSSSSSSTLLAAFGGKKKTPGPYAGPSTELRQFPSDRELEAARRRPSVDVAGPGLRMPSGGLRYGLGGYSAVMGAGIGVGGMAGRGLDVNKPLPPNPPREEESGEEGEKGKGRGKEKGKEKK